MNMEGPQNSSVEKIKHPNIRRAVIDGLKAELRKKGEPVPLQELADTFFPGNPDSSLVKKALLEMKERGEVVIYKTQGKGEMVALQISEVA